MIMRIIISIGIIVSIASIVFVYTQFILSQNNYAYTQLQSNRYENMHAHWQDIRLQKAKKYFAQLQDEGCKRVEVSYTLKSCTTSREECFDQVQYHELRDKPVCTDWGVDYLDTPESVRGIYLTSHAAGDMDIRNRLLTLVQNTEINTVVIDIKETDGVVATQVGDYARIPFQEERMPGIQALLEELYEAEVYTIARIVLFKDQKWAEVFPQDAIKQKDNSEEVWTDYRGKTYIDPASPAYRSYLVTLSERVHQMGFDEIQVDYVRFPSDGDTANTYYPYSQEKLEELGLMDGRVAVIENFLKDYSDRLRKQYPDIVLSADTFGMTTSLSNDLTIGQMQESFMKYFDYVSPMVYPSHYPEFFVPLEGHPDNHPYEVVKKAMNDGVVKAERAGQDPNKLRPWLQDFTCAWCDGYFPYGAKEVREQIQATYDTGLDSWILWNAGSRYTRGALEPTE